MTENGEKQTMLTDSEILSTLEMLENENLDVRTVTLGINLLDCASHDPAKVKQKIVHVQGVIEFSPN